MSLALAVATASKLRDVLADHQPGDRVRMEIYRGTNSRTLRVTLGRQPTS